MRKHDKISPMASLSTIRSLRYWEKGFKTRIKWQYGPKLPWSVYVENLSDLLPILFQYHWHILGLSQNTTEHRICFSKTGWLADHFKALGKIGNLMSNRFFIGICNCWCKDVQTVPLWHQQSCRRDFRSFDKKHEIKLWEGSVWAPLFSWLLYDPHWKTWKLTTELDSPLIFLQKNC